MKRKPATLAPPGLGKSRAKSRSGSAQAALARLPLPAAPSASEQDLLMLRARLSALEFELEQKDDMLAKGFNAFSEAAEKLNRSFQRTREEVAALNEQIDQKNKALDEKNQELERNLFEKEKVKNYLASIFESLPVGVLVTDLQGGVTSVNRAGQGMMGAGASDLIGENVNALMGAPLVPPAEPTVELRDPLHFVRKDRQTLKLQVSVTQMRGEAQQAIGYVVNVQDVTLLKQLEEHAERRNRFTVMGEMAANIAHEIRNPLGSIELFASLVRKGLAEGDERMTLMNHISSAITSMNHIISNVLEYSKPRSAHLQAMDLHALLRELDGFFRFMANQNGVELALELEAPRAQIKGDRELLKQALHNLLLNAVQAMPEGGTLTLSTAARTVTSPDVLSRFGPAAHGHAALPVVRVQVRDTGMGMSPEMRGKIFDPFFTTRSRGTGLGLAIVHTIVEAHHGTIDVESQPGLGTTFALMVPTLPP